MARSNPSIDAREFSQLLKQAGEFDKKLTNQLRRNLRKAAEPAVKDVQSKLKSPPPSAASNSRRITRYVNKTKRTKTGVDENGKGVFTVTKSIVRESFSVREALARGTSLAVTKAKSGGRVSIKTSPRLLPANRRVMAKAYNKESWRHPTFGNSEVWHEQSGNPYFGAVILEHRRALAAAVERALDEAVDIVAPRTGRARRVR